MKFILQITLGVFLGTLASQMVIDYWHRRIDNSAKASQEKLQLERQRARNIEGEKIRKLLLNSRKANTQINKKLEPAFVPDDAQNP